MVTPCLVAVVCRNRTTQLAFELQGSQGVKETVDANRIYLVKPGDGPPVDHAATPSRGAMAPSGQYVPAAGGGVGLDGAADPAWHAQPSIVAGDAQFRLQLEVDAAHERVILYRMILVVLGILGMLLGREWLLELLGS
jgi:hypothetical protein